MAGDKEIRFGWYIRHAHMQNGKTITQFSKIVRMSVRRMIQIQKTVTNITEIPESTAYRIAAALDMNYFDLARKSSSEPVPRPLFKGDEEVGAMKIVADEGSHSRTQLKKAAKHKRGRKDG